MLTSDQKIRFLLPLGMVMLLVSYFLGLPDEARAQNPKPEAELFLVAQKAFDDGFYDVAQRYIEQYLAKYPASESRVKAQLILGQCYFFNNQYLKAFEIFQKLLDYSEYKDATLFWLGETYFKGGDYKAAETYYRQLIDFYPKSEYRAQGFYSLGWTYFSQGDFKLAKETFETLIHLFPEHQLTEDAVFKRGECAYNLSDYEKAVQLFKEYILSYPQSVRHPEAFYYIAEASHYKGDYLTSVTYYAKTAEVAREAKLVVTANVGAAWSYLKLEKLDLAQRFFAEALKVAEEKSVASDEIYLGLASLYAQKGENQSARDAYQTLIAKFPDSQRLLDAYLGKANTDYVLKDYPSAVSGYQWVIERAKKSETSAPILEKGYYGLAWTYLKSGDIDRSIQTFEIIMNKTQSKVVKVSALTQIGDAYQDVDQLEKALSVYDRVLREYPDSLYTDYVQFRQAIALLKLNRIEAAMLSLQSLQAHFPGSKYLDETKYYLGLAYFKKEDWEQAIAYIQDYLKTEGAKDNLAAESNYILGLAQFNLKAYTKARVYFERVVKDFPDQKSMVRISEISAAKCQYYLGQKEEGLHRLADFKTKNPGTEAAQEALIFMAQHALEHDEPQAAVSHYTEFLKDFPGSEKIGQVHYELGQAFQALNQPDKAVAQYQLSSQSPDRIMAARAQLAIADLFSRDQQGDTALDEYQKIADNAPDFKRDALVKMARIYKDRKQYPKALSFYEQALSAAQGESEIASAEIQFAVADTYELLDQGGRAVESYLKIPYLYADQTSWVVKAYLRSARIFEDTESWEDARKVYEKVIALQVDEAKYARERLDSISDNMAP